MPSSNLTNTVIGRQAETPGRSPGRRIKPDTGFGRYLRLRGSRQRNHDILTQRPRYCCISVIIQRDRHLQCIGDKTVFG